MAMKRKPTKKKPVLRAKAPLPSGPSGQCACGGVRFTVARPIDTVFTCHCSKCRRWHGHYGAYARVRRADLAFEAQKSLAWYQVSPQVKRGFCQACGGSLFFDGGEAKVLYVSPGALDSPTGLKLVAHLFTGSKGDYYQLGEDGAARFEAFPD